ncbi:MAG: glycosyltransferase family 2 protein, partial [Candidatus Tectomicrobia bacterium]|nr:glycosyltransferase family 2 protein [Candidatus Tectomicrobia bacterium]
EDVTYSKIRMIPKAFLRRFACWIAQQNIPDINSGMRVFRKSSAERYMNILPDGFSFTTTLTLAMLTNYYDVRYVPINYAPRLGKSKIHPIMDTLKFFQLIIRTGTYFAPIRVFSPLIVLLSIAFLISLNYDLVVGKNLTDKTVIFLMFTINTTIFTLLADMIDKRMSR